MRNTPKTKRETATVPMEAKDIHELRYGLRRGLHHRRLHDRHLKGIRQRILIPQRIQQILLIAKALAETDIILNLSGAGMRGKEDDTCVDKKYLKPNHICFDATYNPTVTRFLKEAAEVGCKTINGLDMSLYQGVRQIQLWTGGEKVPVDVMRQELLTILEEKNKG